jgi:hypothetical protein
VSPAPLDLLNQTALSCVVDAILELPIRSLLATQSGSRDQERGILESLGAIQRAVGQAATELQLLAGHEHKTDGLGDTCVVCGVEVQVQKGAAS